MRALIWIFLACLLSACASRSTPPEIPILHEQKPLPLRKSETIVIDAGHGGKDCGSASQRDSYKEKELTLETALMVRTCVNQLGYKTVMTSNQDTYVPLSERAEMANSLEAHLFVSIHYNYSSNSKAKGIEVYYFKEDKANPSSRIVESKVLGKSVLK